MRLPLTGTWVFNETLTGATNGVQYYGQANFTCSGGAFKGMGYDTGDEMWAYQAADGSGTIGVYEPTSNTWEDDSMRVITFTKPVQYVDNEDFVKWFTANAIKVDIMATTTPKSGVTYTEGLSGLTTDEISSCAKIISNSLDITNTTSSVYIDSGDLHRKISIADQVTIPLNGTDYAFDVIGFNHDTLTNTNAYGTKSVTGKAGITFQMHDCFATTYVMNNSNTNSGGWKSSAMRTSTMAIMKRYMPTAWQTAIKTVNKVSGTGGGSSSGTEAVSDSCFLLAEIEIFGSTIPHSVSGEGTQYAYYKAGRSKVKNRSGSTSSWWERSPDSNSNSFFCYASSGGKATRNYASTVYSVAFGFCI